MAVRDAMEGKGLIISQRQARQEDMKYERSGLFVFLIWDAKRKINEDKDY